MAIKNIIFDFGKVLVDYDFEKFFRSYIKDPKRCQEFAYAINDPEVMKRLDRGAEPIDVILKDVVDRHPAFEEEIRYFDRHYLEIVTGEVPGMRDLMTRLKDHGYRLFGLTNWCSKVYGTISQFGIFNLLEGYVISSEEKLIKPEPEIYLRLCERFDLKPEECIFTDDKAENIEGAISVGMKAILFRNAGQFENDLSQLFQNHC